MSTTGTTPHGWVPVTQDLPPELQTVWLTNGTYTCLGCIVYVEHAWLWAKSNGIIYQDNERIVAECEIEDLHVTHWHAVPDVIIDGCANKCD